MSRMSSGSPRGADLFFWAFCLVVLANAALFTVAWLGGTLGAAVTGHGWHPPPFTLGAYLALISGDTGTLWPGVSPYAVYSGMLVVAVLVVVPAVTVGRGLLDRRGRGVGLARVRDLAPLAPAGIAARARELRPSLAGVRQLAPDETGNLLGDLAPNGPELRSSFEDVELDLMAPGPASPPGSRCPGCCGPAARCC